LPDSDSVVRAVFIPGCWPGQPSFPRTVLSAKQHREN